MTGKQQNRLSAVATYKLFDHLQGHYVASGLSDEKFAEHAAKALGFAVSPWNVTSARRELEIQANVVAAPKTEVAVLDVTPLVQSVDRLSDALASAIVDVLERIEQAEQKITEQHWFRLPPALRARVWRAYRPGQEVDKRPSEEYLAVAHDVDAWVREHGGKP